MRKIKACLAAAIFILFGASAFAADATVTYVSGKVEVQRGGKWVALNKGDTVAKSETISTGFQSEAKIKIMDSVMYLGPVTRITLEELSTSGKQDNVNVYLKTGTTRSQVKHVDNKRVNYQVHTAVAVASCRGTDWIIDDSNNITCFEGMVAVAPYIEDSNASGNGMGKRAGKESESSGDDKEGEETASAEEIAGEDTASVTEGAAAVETKTEETSLVSEKPSSADGVLVRANQVVSVSQTANVSAPVNTIVTAANKVTATVSTVAEKETVTSSVVAPSIPEAAAKVVSDTTQKTGSLVLTFTFEDGTN